MKWHGHHTCERRCPVGAFWTERAPLEADIVTAVIAAGGCWVRRAGTRKKRRVKDPLAVLHPGDHTWLYYDTNALQPPPEPPFPLFEHARRYGMWFKPANTPSQGTPAGDAHTLVSWCARRVGRPVHLVNRLDRETAGIVAVAYDPRTAAALTRAWRDAIKRYQAVCASPPDLDGDTIDLPLDGKWARTRVRVVGPHRLGTAVTAVLETGRTHQVRRHLALCGAPVVGDPRYGARRPGVSLQLVCCQVQFTCPLSRIDRTVAIPADRWLFPAEPSDWPL